MMPSPGRSTWQYARYAHDVYIALEAIRDNALRSLLTALGIIFGVAAVISMLAIGQGAKQEILHQLELVGVNNIVVTPIAPEKLEESGNSKSSPEGNRWPFGLTTADAKAIAQVLPTVSAMSVQINYSGALQCSSQRMHGAAVGVNSSYFSIYHLPLQQGSYFTPLQEQSGAQVCVIGAEVRTRLFGATNPIGAYVKFENLWLLVVGVLQHTDAGSQALASMGINMDNSNIYIPAQTLLMRYSQRGTETYHPKAGIGKSPNGYPGLDGIIVQIDDAQQVTASKQVIDHILSRRHAGHWDFEVIVPEQVLKQQQRTNDVFNWVLGAIAGISLLVGGIGIMNIMFASVLERIKEIGIRLAIGARQSDIAVQFLAEALLISLVGGLIGILLGIVLSAIITHLAAIKTVITWSSLLVSFGVAALVGAIFGYAPARRAAQRSPIESLRHE